MKQSTLGFAEGMLAQNAQLAKSQGKPMMAFDWDRAAEIIKAKYEEHPDLKAEAGLQGDWDYTGGTIFEDGEPTNDNYTYLASNWATPTLILSYDGDEQEEIECSTEQNNRFHDGTKWDDKSLAILGMKIPG